MLKTLMLVHGVTHHTVKSPLELHPGEWGASFSLHQLEAPLNTITAQHPLKLALISWTRWEVLGAIVLFSSTLCFTTRPRPLRMNHITRRKGT